jgi:CDP-6-deoxy-D-xylo-4-hexulose-3-dehydrase
MITLGNVKLNDYAKELAMKCLNENKIGQTEYIEQFEEKFAKFMRVDYAVAVSSGTMADTIALAVLKNIYPEKKKVLVPALTFIAQVNSIIYNGLEPIFYDIDSVSDYNEEILCKFPVHLLGKPTKEYKIYPGITVEDACEALGSKRLSNEYNQ